MRSFTRSLAAAIAFLAATAAPLAGQPADTTEVSATPLFTKRDLWIAAGFAVGTMAMHPADKSLARRIRREPLQENHTLQRSADFFDFMGADGPKYIGVSMYAIGRLAGVERMADLGLHGTEALVAARVLTLIAKGAAGRARPLHDIEDPYNFAFGRGFRGGADEYRSFPSGHTSSAFAAAAAVTAETSRWWPETTWLIAPVMFGGATLVGISRMYDNKHWASDVVIGAAIGTFSGWKVVSYHHSHPANKIDEWLLSTSILPDGRGGAILMVSLLR